MLGLAAGSSAHAAGEPNDFYRYTCSGISVTGDTIKASGRKPRFVAPWHNSTSGWRCVMQTYYLVSAS
jgi:hypothetical protein